MKKLLAVLFRLYTFIPYLFFIILIISMPLYYAAHGQLSINDRFLDFAPIAIMTIVCVIGMTLLPIVVAIVIGYNHRKWRRALYPVLSYGLYLCAVVFAGHMGWWTD